MGKDGPCCDAGPLFQSKFEHSERRQVQDNPDQRSQFNQVASLTNYEKRAGGVRSPPSKPCPSSLDILGLPKEYLFGEASRFNRDNLSIFGIISWKTCWTSTNCMKLFKSKRDILQEIGKVSPLEGQLVQKIKHYKLILLHNIS